MKGKAWTEKRWFWPAVCLLSLAAGWWYLSITTCAQLGGDDEIINLQNYYFATHHGFWEVLQANWESVLPQFLLQSGRFRPFSSPPLLGWTSYFLGDLVGYRLYILAWTYADIALTGYLVGRASRSKKMGLLCFCLLPMMFSLEPLQIVQTAQKRAPGVGIFSFSRSGAASAALLLFCFGCARGCKNGYSGQSFHLLRRRLPAYGGRCTLF